MHPVCSQSLTSERRHIPSVRLAGRPPEVNCIHQCCLQCKMVPNAWMPKNQPWKGLLIPALNMKPIKHELTLNTFIVWRAISIFLLQQALYNLTMSRQIWTKMVDTENDEDCPPTAFLHQLWKTLKRFYGQGIHGFKKMEEETFRYHHCTSWYGRRQYFSASC